MSCPVKIVASSGFKIIHILLVYLDFVIIYTLFISQLVTFQIKILNYKYF